MKLKFIYTTFNQYNDAIKVKEHLVSSNLAICVNLFKEVESIYQAAMDRLGPDQPDKNEDWNAWYTWTSQKLQSTESYNYSMGKLKNTRTVRLPYEYGEGPLTTINHSFNVDGKFCRSKFLLGIK